MNECTAGCGRAVSDEYVCRVCGDQLVEHLAAVPELAAELDVTLTRQGRTGLPVGSTSGSPSKPLPFDERASAVLGDLRAILVGWVRLCVEEHLAPGRARPSEAISGSAWGDSLPEDTFEALAAFLTVRVEALRHHPAGEEAVDEITAVVRRARNVVDVAEARWYAGRCACGMDLYARASAAGIVCPGCATTYDVAERRAALLRSVEDVLATTTEISRAVTSFAHELTPGAIRAYVQRGRLVAKGTRGGKPVYRVGDVLELVVAARSAASR